MKFIRTVILSLVVASFAACSTTEAKTDNQHSHKVHWEYTPYDSDTNARSVVDAALAESEADGKMTIIAMGANWCHDSRGFAAQFAKERFKPLLDEHFRLVYVDVGKKNRNIDIAQSFGVDNIVGTPTVFVVSPEGNVLNLDTAPTWRNAHSRSEDDIYGYFEEFTKAASLE